MEYLTAHPIGGVDSDGRVFFRVDFDGKALTFTEMSTKHGFSLVCIVPINANEANWKGAAIFARPLQSNSLLT